MTLARRERPEPREKDPKEFEQHSEDAWQFPISSSSSMADAQGVDHDGRVGFS